MVLNMLQVTIRKVWLHGVHADLKTRFACMNSLYPVTGAACVTLSSNTGWLDLSCLLYSDDICVCEVPASQGLSFLLFRKEVAGTIVPIKQIHSFSCVDM